MSLSLKDKGKSAQGTVYVENDGDKAIAVEVSIAKRIMDINGGEEQPLVEDDFLVYPSQLIIGAGEKKAVKVKWLEKKVVKGELPYRLIAEQLPINMEKRKIEGGGQINILLRYVASLYVVGPDASSKVEVESILKNKNKLQITLHNKGNKHQILNKLKVFLEGSSERITLNEDQLEGMAGENILGGNKRVFQINWPKQLKTTDKVIAKISYE